MTALLLDIEGPRPLRAALVTTGHAAVRRVRVTLRPAAAPDRLVEDTHLRVRLPAAAPWPTLADVLLERGNGEPAARDLAARHPGALVTGTHLGTRCWLRLSVPEPVEVALGAAHFAGLPWPSWASLAHTWHVAGLPGAELAASRVRVLRVSRTPVRGGAPRVRGGTPSEPAFPSADEAATSPPTPLAAARALTPAAPAAPAASATPRDALATPSPRG